MIPLLLLSWLAATSDADTSTQELQARAEAAIARGMELRDDPPAARHAFAEAADAYAALRARGAENPELYRNLGNAHLLAGKLPEAIFAYLKGLTLDPDNRQLRDSLDFARAQIDFSHSATGRPPSDDRPPWLPNLTPRTRLLLAGAFLALFWLTLTRYVMTRHGIHILFGGFCIVAVGVCTASMLADYRAHREQIDKPLVVVHDDGVELRTGNGADYPARDNVPALKGGMEGELLGKRADLRGVNWLRIRLASGEVGWVRADEALVDE
jgi:tetratricopeptide (TPR) repeat protein